METDNNPSFISWLFSKHEMVEKTVGMFVLTAEIMILLQEFYGVERKPEEKVFLTDILNLLFLVFIYSYLRAYLAKRFTVKADSEEDIAGIFRVSDALNRKDKINVLVFQANTFISQLKSINYFILFTAGLYVLFLLQIALKGRGIQHPELFHLLIDLFSYAGAFYLLRCFFVMYLPTIDENGNDILNRKTAIYILLGAALMAFDLITVSEVRGRFVSEFICGAINSVIFILLIARFENKILDIPPFILCILYVYAILQTCLPVVTGQISGEIMPSKTIEDPRFLDTFSNTVLTICLIGKITLFAVLLYVLSTKRIFYYFMSLRRIHEEEEKNWGKFHGLVEDFSVAPEKFTILYDRNRDSTYTARMPESFGYISGQGRTPEEAKKQLRGKMEASADSSVEKPEEEEDVNSMQNTNHEQPQVENLDTNSSVRLQSTIPNKPPDGQLAFSQLKDHIVQIEALLAYLLICVVTLFVLNAVIETGKSRFPLWLVPTIFLVGFRVVMRVNNPTAPIRKRLTWAATLGGVLGAIGGAAVDIFSLGLTAGQGTLIGIGAGAAIGAAAGNRIENWGARDELLQRGDAFDYLYKHRKKNPNLANPSLVEEALEKKIPHFDKNKDGRQWYALDDLEAFVKKKK